MASLPRILTVDPANNIATQIRAAFDLMDRLVVQIDVPNAEEALDEFSRGGVDAVISSWEPGDDMQGWALAAKLRQMDENIRVILLGDYDDIDMDEETLQQSPFIYLKRPFDIPQLIRVLRAVLDGGDPRDALYESVQMQTPVAQNLGDVPSINLGRAEAVINTMITDLGALSVTLCTREGEIVFQQGSVSYIDQQALSFMSVKSVLTNIDLRDMIGGNAATVQFFDGDEYDIYLLSVGLHYFVTIIYEGTRGQREMAGVLRFGRRGVEDLIGILGASAWLLSRPTVLDNDDFEDEQVVRKSQSRRRQTDEVREQPELERAQISRGATQEVEEVEIESVLPQLDAIDDEMFDADALFDMDFDMNAADDFFSLDSLSDLTADEGQKGTLDWGKATELGILDD